MYKIIGLILLIGIGETSIYTLLDLDKQIELKKISIEQFNNMSPETKSTYYAKSTWLEQNKIIMGKYAEIRSQLKLDANKWPTD